MRDFSSSLPNLTPGSCQCPSKLERWYPACSLSCFWRSQESLPERTFWQNRQFHLKGWIWWRGTLGSLPEACSAMKCMYLSFKKWGWNRTLSTLLCCISLCWWRILKLLPFPGLSTVIGKNWKDRNKITTKPPTYAVLCTIGKFPLDLCLTNNLS